MQSPSTCSIDSAPLAVLASAWASDAAGGDARRRGAEVDGGAGGDAHGDVEARGAAEAAVRGTSTVTRRPSSEADTRTWCYVVAARSRRRRSRSTSSAMTWTVPRPLRRWRWTGPSVGKRWVSVGMVGLLDRVGGRSAAGEAGGAARAAAVGDGGGLEGGLDGADHPGVHRQALGGGLLPRRAP